MTEIIYIDSATSLLDRITRIDTIIDALLLQISTVGTGHSDIASYNLNDGQTTISTSYTTPELIQNAITGFERMRERYVNKLNGRGMILRDVRGLQ
jgi:hypothetical protein